MTHPDRNLLAVTSRQSLTTIEAWQPNDAGTTARHPRTLNEAFNDADRATWFYPDDNPWTWRLGALAAVVVAGVASCVLLAVGVAS